MPFAGYEDFKDCVAKNADKENPEAYCASIQQKVEGEDSLATDVDQLLYLRRLAMRKENEIFKSLIYDVDTDSIVIFDKNKTESDAIYIYEVNRKKIQLTTKEFEKIYAKHFGCFYCDPETESFTFDREYHGDVYLECDNCYNVNRTTIKELAEASGKL